MLLSFIFFAVITLGYLAQATGLCMFKGVNEWKQGNKEHLMAILLSGVLVWVSTLFAYLVDIPFHFRIYESNTSFLLGGFLFGLGTAFNKGCGISTLTKLTKGDIKMLATITGWLAGWTIFAYWSPDRALTQAPLLQLTHYLSFSLISVGLVIWVSFGNKERKKLWFSMLSIGLLSGFIYLYQPKWSPNALLSNLSKAFLDNQIHNWPSLEQYLLFIALLIGMFLGALNQKKFLFISSSFKYWIFHLCAGVLMGVGASLALGGNSVQLLLAIPTLSPAGFVSVAGILLGIWSGIYLQKAIKQ